MVEVLSHGKRLKDSCSSPSHLQKTRQAQLCQSNLCLHALIALAGSIDWRRPCYNWGRSMTHFNVEVAHLASWQHDTVGRLPSSRGAV